MNPKNNIYRKGVIFIFVIFSPIFLSCTKSVEVGSPNDKINKEDVYTDIATTKAALNYLYSRLRDSAIFSRTSSGVAYSTSLHTDELIYVGNNYNTFFDNAIQASNTTTANWWNFAYQDLYAINAFIENLTISNTLDKNITDQLLGEAFTIRAIYYQNMAQLFGDIPYTTTTDYRYNTTISKTSYNQVLKLIEADLLKALDLISYTYRGSDKVYLNKASTELILAENYLLQKEYEKAEYYSLSLTNNSQYKLEDDILRIFKKGATSTLLELTPVSAPSNTPEVTEYLFTALGASSSSISENLYQLFELNDLRKTNWINTIKINNEYFYQPYKYKNKGNNLDELSVVYRIEKAYFFLAESLVYQDKVADAIQVINIIRNKRNLSNLDSNLSRKDFLEELLNESFREFFTESGDRFFTLKRTNQTERLTTLKPNWQPFHILFPIPEKQLLINPKLLPNNYGY